jgi:hypothetical protein
MTAMKKNATKRPNGLTPAERKAWDDIVREMESCGINPGNRIALIKDYIKLEGRIGRLESREENALLGNIQASRAINVAIAERRRLHAALFAGARKAQELPPAPTPTQVRERKAYTAWSEFYEGLDGWKDRSPEDRAAREAELTLLYGEPPMALVLPRWPKPTRESVQEFFDWMKR